MVFSIVFCMFTRGYISYLFEDRCVSSHVPRWNSEHSRCHQRASPRSAIPWWTVICGDLWILPISKNDQKMTIPPGKSSNCLLVEPTPLKNDGVKVSWDDYSIPKMMGKSYSNPAMFQSPPTSHYQFSSSPLTNIINHHYPWLTIINHYEL